LIDPAEARQFCCAGCRTVYAMLRDCGLERFYKLRQNADTEPVPARTTDRRYAEFDDQAFRELYCQPAADGLTVVELYLEGVHCAACVWLVEKLPQVVPGVLEARLDLRRSLVRVRWDDGQVPLSRIARSLDSLGYPPHPAKDARARALRRQEDHRFLIRIGVAAACVGNVMTLAFALYGGVFTGIEAQYSHLFRWASMFFGIIALAWPGSVFFRGAWAALRTRTAHLDLPIALGLGAGGVAGTLNAVLGRGEIYFDSLTMLVFLLLVGRWIQRRQQRWANDALELLFSLTPTVARRVEPDGIREVPLEAIGPGDLLEVRAGDSVPADGRIEEGASALDQSLLTGESRPVAVRPGDPVHAGTVNVSARILVRVEAVGDHTRVGRLMRLVEECSRNRAPLVQFADRVAGRFVIAVLALAAATFGLWLWLDASRALDHAVALLIVTCPCALGLATPLAVTVALGRAARRRILIKGGAALEHLAGRGTIVLDKTGTLTAGRMAVVSWHGDASVQPLVASLERHSAHPIAQALVAAYSPESPSREPTAPAGAAGPARDSDQDGERRGVSPPVLSGAAASARDRAAEPADVEQTTGGGLGGAVAGRRVVVGSPKFVRSQGATMSDELAAAEKRVVSSAATPVLVAVAGRVVAVAGLADPLRDDARAAVDALRRLGWQPQILSGDHPDVVRTVARQLGVPDGDAQGGATPEEKVVFVRQAAQRRPVIMVGDGVNDAAALSAATVGIAVHGGAEASLAAADVYLNRPGLTPIIDVIQAARGTVRTIRRCFVASLFYNAIAATLAITGWISPLAAAVLMPISSFTVLALAYATRTFAQRERRASAR
jgi:Cu2+-exporting ATPase